ncbi:MAG: type I-E CRISPR-associated protein Cse1/CasA [Aristaeellaceae bacterium]
MEEKAFNLLDEPWIRVMLPDCTVREVSLTEALMQAHTFTALAGEMPTQDVAVLRLLLAVLHTVFERVDETGQNHPIQDADDALDRWAALWQGKQFPEKPIRAYLDAWHERFYLFHPQRPFYQVREAEKGTEFTAAKLNGAISESSNKVRLFAMRAGAAKEKLSYSEAARWLLCLNGYDDTSAKPKGKDLPSPGAGWLGKLGLVIAQGDNLFETLMLNLVLLNDKSECWGKNVPVWELERPRTQERTEISLPDNQAQLLTLQSRRLLLVREDNQVVGYQLLGGDFFDKANAFAEQMTLWMKVQAKGNQPDYVQPKRHDASKKIWREFSAMFVGKDEKLLPGVVHWQSLLKREDLLLSKHMTRFQIASVQYGDKDFFVADAFSDTLGFHLGLLTDAGKVWVAQILSEINTVDELAQQVWFLGANIEQAAGGSGDALGNDMKEQFYDHIDIPFRRFLAAVDPADDDDQRNERLLHWHQEARSITLALGREAVAQAGQAAFVGRTIEDKKGKKYHYSLPEAYNQFLYQVNQRLKDTRKE